MLNDEQILLKTAKLLENFDISEQKTEKLLRELDETELEAIEDVLDDMKGEDLAFNKLFDGEMRKIINFPTMDNATELGKFGEFFKKQDLDVDWEKGLVSAERDVRTSDDLLNTLIGMGRGDPEKTKTKKIQMKIGKFFAKVADLSSKKKVLTDKVLDFAKNNRDKLPMKFGERSPTSAGEITGNMMQTVFSPEELKRYNQLSDQLSLYIPNPGYVPRDEGAWATKMAKYWQTNAGYIKKEINKLDNDKFSIIITRHPIDVMRMSDFNNISSCHSPPSRGGGSQEYYKCAVAEAMGHGALAYVVETDKLLEITDSESIEAAEGKIQEGEIFADEVRGSHIGLYHPKLELSPISRTRLRQMRYYTDQDLAGGSYYPKRWDEGTELAVPEIRIYGAAIPGLYERVAEWARENQEKAIEKMPIDGEDGEAINLDRFWIFGGSYEDTAGAEGRKALLSRLIGRPELDFTGNVHQNQDTEGELDANALSGLAGRWRTEVEEIMEEWNNRYANLNIQAEVEDNYDGGFYISVRPTMQWSWSLNEFTGLPNSYPTGMHVFSSINDIWGDIFDDSDGFINNYDGKNVRIGCTINLDHPDVWGEGSVLYDPDNLRELCAVLDTKMDDRRDSFKATIEEFLKREGWMVGGTFMNLAVEIEDGTTTSYEWDLDTDGNYTESYEVYASYSFEYNPEEWEMSYEILIKLLESREYRLLLRSNLIAGPRAQVGTEYYLDIAHYTVTRTGQEAVVQIQFKVDADDPDERVELFKDLIEGDMDDEDNLRVVFNKTLAQIKASHGSGVWGDDVTEKLVKNWKRYIS